VADRIDRAAPEGREAVFFVSLRRGRIAAALVLCVLGLAFALAALDLDFGSVGLPGPGFFPFVLGMLLAGFSLAAAVGAMRDPAGREEIVALGHRDVLIAMLALVGVALAFEPLGAFLTLGLFAATLLVLIGRVSPLLAALAAVIGMIAVWYFFKVLLGLQLPNGPLDFDAVLGLLTGRTGR
jgi:Tripartite tricarboxylate transporter TctB family